MAAVTICSEWEPQNIKSATISTVPPSISHEVVEPDAMIFIFWMLSFKPTFSLSTFIFMIIEVYVSNSNAEEAEVEQFYEYLQDLLELIPPKDVFFNIGDWNAKVGVKIHLE